MLFDCCCLFSCWGSVSNHNSFFTEPEIWYTSFTTQIKGHIELLHIKISERAKMHVSGGFQKSNLTRIILCKRIKKYSKKCYFKYFVKFVFDRYEADYPPTKKTSLTFLQRSLLGDWCCPSDKQVWAVFVIICLHYWNAADAS